MATTTRTDRITIRLTHTEARILRRAARGGARPVSDWIRITALRYAVTPEVPTAEPEGKTGRASVARRPAQSK